MPDSPCGHHVTASKHQHAIEEGTFSHSTMITPAEREREELAAVRPVVDMVALAVWAERAWREMAFSLQQVDQLEYLSLVIIHR
jgi:hypothetical protein